MIRALAGDTSIHISPQMGVGAILRVAVLRPLNSGPTPPAYPPWLKPVAVNRGRCQQLCSIDRPEACVT